MIYLICPRYPPFPLREMKRSSVGAPPHGGFCRWGATGTCIEDGRTIDRDACTQKETESGRDKGAGYCSSYRGPT